jgi:hypothetical protein
MYSPIAQKNSSNVRSTAVLGARGHSGQRRDQTMSAENAAQEQRPRGKPFPKGVSGNPAGRPKGIRNRATVLLEAITDDDLHAIVLMVIEKAKAGDLIAAKLIFDRVAPAPKGRAVTIELPAIGQWDGIDAVLRAYRIVIEAVSAGDASPAEGLELVALIEAQRATIKELRPESMYREPTPEERAEQQRRNEELAKVFDRFGLNV